MTKSRWLVLAAVLCGANCLLAQAPGDEWRYYGGDAGGMRYSPLKQINRSNVQRLVRAWTFHTGDTPALPSGGSKSYPALETTPLMVDGVLYVTTRTGHVIALEATSGEKRWEFDPKLGRGVAAHFGENRGVAYWEGHASMAGQCERRVFVATYDGRLMALNATNGQPCTDFGERGTVDLIAGFADQWPVHQYSITSPPVIYKDLVMTGSELPEYPAKGPSGDIRAFDVRSGKLVWQFHTVPRPGEAGHEVWQGDSWKDRTGVNAWSIMSVDQKRGLVFLPLGSASYDFYGADRKGPDLFANCVVALDAQTGKLRWYFQGVHHDIWDYDFPAQPELVAVHHDGKAVAAVAQVSKMGLVFVLDRDTGKPLFPVEERPVPASEVPGEATSPTQPFPLKPPPLARLSVTREELTTVPESREFCTRLFDSLVKGTLYTPWGLKLTLVWPGTLGGATWSGGAFDPASGYLYVNVNETAAIGYMRKQPEGAPEAYRRASPQGEYARFWDSNEYLCVKPPWGELTAVDLNRGEIVWKVPLGVTDALETEGFHHTGAPNLGGSIVTAGGVVFIAGTNDSRFRAFDAKTGSELWVTRLEANGHALPMTYRGKDGRQYVVIAAGGGGYFSQKLADTIDAFALPRP